MYRDPFRPGTNFLVLCDCYEPPKAMPDGTVLPPKAIPTNTRAACAAVMEKVKGEEPWFGIEQEYSVGGLVALGYGLDSQSWVWFRFGRLFCVCVHF
jgi:hypothetical protein